MPAHWTYADFSADDNLQQGDLLRRTDALLSVLSRVHQFFSDERYVAFAILTQSCDLVRRRGRCKTEHIQLAVIRELESLLPRILEERCGVGVPGVFKKESRYAAQQIIRKIVNQNDQARGLFYLHPETDVGIVTPSVIMLRISIALRREHYDLLCNARCGRLSAEYANKLGWLSGNLYSRVATPDWEDQEDDKDASEKLANEYLDGITQPNYENWVPKAWIDAAKADGIILTGIPTTEFATRINKYAPLTSMDVILERVKQVSQEVVTQRLAEAIKAALVGATVLVDSFIDIVCELVQNDVHLNQRQQLREKLRADGSFCQTIQNHAGSIIKSHLASPDSEGVEVACLSEQTTHAEDPDFPSLRGGFLSADALQSIVNRHVRLASVNCASLQDRRITPHTLRHTAAMALLQHGVDLAVIALWLGHESIETTHQYLHADLQLKERALGYIPPIGISCDS